MVIKWIAIDVVWSLFRCENEDSSCVGIFAGSLCYKLVSSRLGNWSLRLTIMSHGIRSVVHDLGWALYSET